MRRDAVIRAKADGGFTVTVEPALSWTSYDAERPTHATARRYADALRAIHRWDVRDEIADQGGEA